MWLHENFELVCICFGIVVFIALIMSCGKQISNHGVASVFKRSDTEAGHKRHTRTVSRNSSRSSRDDRNSI